MIAEGLKYKVYIEGDRVKKTLKSQSEIKRTCLKKDFLGTFLLEGGLENYSNKIIRSNQKSLDFIKQVPEAHHLLGNPEFEENIIYQDKAVTAKSKLSKNPQEY